MAADNLNLRLDLHRAFWDRRPLPRPLASFRLGDYFFSRQFAAARPLLEEYKKITPDMLDVDAFLADYERMFHEVAEIGQDGFWTGEPFTGIPWVEAMLGCEVYGSAASFITRPWAKSVGDLEKIALDPENPWLLKYLEFCRKLNALSQGRFPIGHPIMRGLSDTLGAALGQTELVFAVMEEPERMQNLFYRVASFYREIIGQQTAVTDDFYGGRALGFYHVWAPGSAIWFQEDLSALLSPRLYRDLLLAPDRSILAGYQYTAVHLHPVSFFILDDLLRVDELRAIQVNKDVGGPSVREMLPQLKKIAAVKSLIIWGDLDEADIDCIAAELPGQAVFLNIVAPDLGRAKALMEHLRAKEG